MEQPEKSGMLFYSIGYVAENKSLGSKIIKVTPVETIPMVDGEIKSSPSPLEDSGVDSDGNSYTVKVSSDNAIEAKWLPFGSNRMTAPDVRRGERVMLWRYADAEQLYWTDLGFDEHLRRLETVIMSISGTQDEGTEALDPDNTYYLEASSHNKSITLRTSQKNGEFTRYTFQFNLADGAVTLADDLGNFFELDSAETKLTLQNVEGTMISLDKQNIIGNAPKNIDLTAGAMFRVTVGGSVFTMTPGGTTLKTPKFAGSK